MEQVQKRMQGSGIPLFWESYSALDRYFGVRDPGPIHILTDSSLITLAQAFDDLQYPGLLYADACLEREECRVVFRCVDSIDRSPSHPFTAQNLIYSVDRDAFKASSSVAVSSYNFGCGVSRGCARCLCAAEAYAQELVANCFAFHRPVGQVSRLAR